MGNLFDRLHEKYVSRVNQERERLKKENWSVGEMESYVNNYIENPFSFFRTFLGFEPALFEACVEESAYKKMSFSKNSNHKYL